MKKATRIVVLLFVLALSTTPSPAQADDDVLVRVGISAGGYAPAACPVFVAPGTSGLGVLDAAVELGCIGGYEMDGAWLRCITIGVVPVCSDVHKDPLSAGTHYWAIYEDAGAVAPHSLGEFTAGIATHSRLLGNVPVGHTELELSFESWVKCLTYPVLCNPQL